MANELTRLQKTIESGGSILLAEVSPPQSADPEHMRTIAKKYAGKVHALGISDNRNGVVMSALAAASLTLQEGMEPVLHIVTRDRNRIALISECLGAQALGIGNLFCTSGTHQTLGSARQARNVYDLDSIQLLQAYSTIASDSSLVGGNGGMNGVGRFCLGGTATPYADPMEMQLIRLSKKILAGAQYLITQPIFDMDRFNAFWTEVTKRGIHEKVAIVAGIRVLTDADEAKAYAIQRPVPRIPESILQTLSSEPNKDAQRLAGIRIATDAIKKLSQLKGLRGFEIRGEGDDEAALQVIAESGLKVS